MEAVVRDAKGGGATDDDTLAHARRPTGVGFDSSGFLAVFYTGVAQELESLGVLKPGKTPLAGVSGGSLVASTLAIGVNGALGHAVFDALPQSCSFFCNKKPGTAFADFQCADIKSPLVGTDGCWPVSDACPLTLDPSQLPGTGQCKMFMQILPPVVQALVSVPAVVKQSEPGVGWGRGGGGGVVRAWGRCGSVDQRPC